MCSLQIFENALILDNPCPDWPKQCIALVVRWTVVATRSQTFCAQYLDAVLLSKRLPLWQACLAEAECESAHVRTFMYVKGNSRWLKPITGCYILGALRQKEMYSLSLLILSSSWKIGHWRQPSFKMLSQLTWPNKSGPLRWHRGCGVLLRSLTSHNQILVVMATFSGRRNAPTHCASEHYRSTGNKLACIDRLHFVLLTVTLLSLCDASRQFLLAHVSVHFQTVVTEAFSLLTT